ncbi:hypothetical protein EYF80_020042 [Liparis tanakae]|uniref:Uncharacterized protein n=1 Tax=Liparis tanakae TaxID=230148 RepID=A0A4Z2HVI3_9TELE|nr:hypothetical protein EYF80_020042 [Liparis tanakae]
MEDTEQGGTVLQSRSTKQLPSDPQGTPAKCEVHEVASSGCLEASVRSIRCKAGALFSLAGSAMPSNCHLSATSVGSSLFAVTVDSLAVPALIICVYSGKLGPAARGAAGGDLRMLSSKAEAEWKQVCRVRSRAQGGPAAGGGGTPAGRSVWATRKSVHVCLHNAFKLKSAMEACMFR